MNTMDFDYPLPQELIAQHPAKNREDARLLAVNRQDHTVTHASFRDFLSYLRWGDCLVLNDTKVFPARLFGTKESTGASVELLLVRRLRADTWEALVRPAKRVRTGDRIVFGTGELIATTLFEGDQGMRTVELSYDGSFDLLLQKLGAMPLPPYIERDAQAEDATRYQTVYSRHEGSIAAPTAGLHFTEPLLAEAERRGTTIAYVTLHVGIGTFRPVKSERIEDHPMHSESYRIDRKAVDAIQRTKEQGGRIVACGTTVCRTLESAADERGALRAGSGDTDLFIYPGYEFKVVDALLTNFHLPKSTLLMLVSAFYERERVLEVYNEAVQQRYRFFSYGDAMWIE